MLDIHKIKPVHGWRELIGEIGIIVLGVPIALGAEQFVGHWHASRGENAEFDVASARAGRIESFLQPADRAIDMVSAQDIGRVASELLREVWHGRRVVGADWPMMRSDGVVELNALHDPHA